MTKVAIWFFLRRQPPGLAQVNDARLAGDCGHQAPLIRRAERCTKPRAARLTIIVITNSIRPRPISAARNSPEASGNWFAITAGIE